ncbi:MAG: family 78 glycoside hydrolase catalytic domain [Oscillospiraceae bacterium]|nr:family 78 glycoside hydrolase catalytic domain [Oscillospiraceae bacterium]
MKFHGKWITTRDFISERPVNVFHRELESFDLKNCGIRNYYTLFRRKFVLDSPENTTIRISADDYYKLYINGVFACQGPAQAYFFSYNYNETDISRFLRIGENEISVLVFCQGGISREWCSGDNRQGMIADIFQDGNLLLGTDSTWQYAVLHNRTNQENSYGTVTSENIDFRDKIITFDTAIEDPHDDHIFKDTPVDTVEVYELKPQLIKKLRAGEYFIDVGTEVSGSLSLTVHGKRGQKLTVAYGEEAENDRAKFDLRCNCRYLDEHILSGDTDTLDYFNYKAFRYINISTDIDNLNPDSFRIVARDHRFNEKIALESDIEHLSDIWQICRNALKIGTQEGFLDCPTREKGQYLGDFTVSGLAYLYLTGDAKIYRKTLFDFADSARICPGLLAVAPSSYMQEIADFSLQYPLQILNYYKYTGDSETVCQLFPTVCGVLDFFHQFERPDGLIEGEMGKWNIVDWSPNFRDGYNLPNEREGFIPCHNVINAFYIGAMQIENELAGIIGEPPRHNIDGYKSAYINAFYNHETGLFCDLEDRAHSALHSNAIPAFFGILPDGNRIADFIKEKGLSCGVQFSYFVLKALANLGEYEAELELLTNETYHSWVNMLREGATTCFEAWGRDQKWNTSLCHPWASVPIIAIVEDLAPRFTDKIHIKPLDSYSGLWYNETAVG